MLFGALPFQSSACSRFPSSCDLDVPSGPVTMTIRINEYDACGDTMNADNAYFVTTLSNVPSGFDITNSPPTYNGWCVDLLGFLVDNRYGALPYNVNLYSSLAQNLPSNLNLTASQLKEINYILNVDTLITTWTSPAAPPTWLDKQAAIWSALYSDCGVDSTSGIFVCPSEGRTLSTPFPYGPSNNGCPSAVNQATVNAIVAAAKSNSSYTPQPGQKVAVIVQPEPSNFQSSQCDPTSPYYSYCLEEVGQPMQINIIEAQCHTEKCIKIEKLVSVDGGKTFQQAEDCCHAPVAINGSAEYQMVVKNCGGEDLQNVTVNDDGISYSVGYLAVGQSTTITTGLIPVKCSLSNQFQNTATVTGTSVIDYTTVSASDSACVKCSPPAPPPTCKAITEDSKIFNSTLINKGSYIWFNANFTASGIPSQGATITFTDSTISFTDNNSQFYNLQVPNGKIIFSPSATCPSTTFDSTGSTWVTTVPISGSDEIFLTGLSFPVPANFGGEVPGKVVWSGSFGTANCISINWKWGAAVYSNFSTNYAALGVKPTHSNYSGCAYSNSDHAGTPEAFKSSVVGGATGGGGSNYTGSWSCTVSPELVCQCSSCSQQGSQCGFQQSGWGGKGCTWQGCQGQSQCGSQQSQSGWGWNGYSWH